MSFNDFNVVLVELRKKLGYIGITIAIGTFGIFPFMGDILHRISTDLLPGEAELVFLHPLEVIMLQLQLSVLFGMLVALPMILYYVNKALKGRINPVGLLGMGKYSWIFMAMFSICLFLVGTAYAYFIMLPILLQFLYAEALAAGALATYSIYEFISFAAMMTIIFGLAFQMPMAIFLLVRAGIVDYPTLTQHRKHAIVLIFIVAAIITPPEVITQLMIGIPMVLFYELSLLVIRITSRKHPRSRDM